MAETTPNTALQDIRGRINKWVYRRVNGRTIIAPFRQPTAPPTAGQLMVRDKFSRPAAWARVQFGNPAQRAIYDEIARETEKPVSALRSTDYVYDPRIQHVLLDYVRGPCGA